MVRDLHPIQSGGSRIQPREVAAEFDDFQGPRALRPARKAHAGVGRCSRRWASRLACLKLTRLAGCLSSLRLEEYNNDVEGVRVSP